MNERPDGYYDDDPWRDARALRDENERLRAALLEVARRASGCTNRTARRMGTYARRTLGLPVGEQMKGRKIRDVTDPEADR